MTIVAAATQFAATSGKAELPLVPMPQMLARQQVAFRFRARRAIPEAVSWQKLLPSNREEEQLG